MKFLFENNTEQISFLPSLSLTYVHACVVRPTIDTIELSIRPQGYILTCTSTGSPATNVEWMKDGQPLTVEGIYSQAQTVIDRAASTYNNMLVINDKEGNIVGHTYTCSVDNVVGSDKQNLKIEKRELQYMYIAITILPMEQLG